MAKAESIAVSYAKLIAYCQPRGLYSPTLGIDLRNLNAARMANGQRPLKIARTDAGGRRTLPARV